MILQNWHYTVVSINFSIGFLSADWLIVKIQPISVQKANQNNQNGKPGCDDELSHWLERKDFDLTGKVFICQIVCRVFEILYYIYCNLVRSLF